MDGVSLAESLLYRDYDELQRMLRLCNMSETNCPGQESPDIHMNVQPQNTVIDNSQSYVLLKSDVHTNRENLPGRDNPARCTNSLLISDEKSGNMTEVDGCVNIHVAECLNSQARQPLKVTTIQSNLTTLTGKLRFGSSAFTDPSENSHAKLTEESTDYGPAGEFSRNNQPSSTQDDLMLNSEPATMASVYQCPVYHELMHPMTEESLISHSHIHPYPTTMCRDEITVGGQTAPDTTLMFRSGPTECRQFTNTFNCNQSGNKHSVMCNNSTYKDLFGTEGLSHSNAMIRFASKQTTQCLPVYVANPVDRILVNSVVNPICRSNPTHSYTKDSTMADVITLVQMHLEALHKQRTLLDEACKEIQNKLKPPVSQTTQRFRSSPSGNHSIYAHDQLEREFIMFSDTYVQVGYMQI
ncbi:hypothetical protein PHET_09386 [Paragonimus heterotremus]|uniref:Uncharacterized protein n=1 Tax=Paragonimus heterotremus TaxID=100268 RepID=A0A8J4SLW9_9TREM|nr:hypothetical protein PHET_09386 [Paragonimus heterotremus]